MYQSDSLVPCGYTKSDFISNKSSRKSTSRYVFALGGEAMSWRSSNHVLLIPPWRPSMWQLLKQPRSRLAQELLDGSRSGTFDTVNNFNLL